MNCPSCKSENVGVHESRLRADGVRRRRYQCFVCKDRWTEFQEPSGRKPKAALLPKQPARRFLTPEEAEAILLSDETRPQLAERFKVSREVIRKIQTHQTYVDVYKKLVVSGKLTGAQMCEACAHWLDGRGCDFGFPDAGGDFANDCYLFRKL